MRTALVTGGSRGIGAAIVQRLMTDGYNVLAPTRQEMDLESNASIDAYLLQIKDRVDILVNDAGINRIAILSDIKDQDVDDTLQINLIAPLRIIREVAPHMKKKGFGRILNISSVWSVVSRMGRISYTMSKAALNGMTRSLAVELAPYNILVNAVAPFCKPMPESFQIAVKIAGEADASKCVRIDDSRRTTRAAREAGLFSILAHSSFADGAADAHLTDWNELKNILEKQ